MTSAQAGGRALWPFLAACALCLCFGAGVAFTSPVGAGQAVPAATAREAGRLRQIVWPTQDPVAFWTMATTLMTGALALVGYVQLRELNRHTKLDRTLAVVVRYDTDPVLDRDIRRIEQGREDGTLASDPRRYKISILSLLNYLDSLALGIEDGVYDEAMALRYTQAIVLRHCAEFLNDPMLITLGADLDHFPALRQLVERWSRR